MMQVCQNCGTTDEGGNVLSGCSGSATGAHHWVDESDDPQATERHLDETEEAGRTLEHLLNHHGYEINGIENEHDAAAVHERLHDPNEVEKDEFPTVQEMVRSNPTMAAMRVELYETAENWLHASVDPDSEVDFDHAALVAYQAMVKYPPKTRNELMIWVLGVIPEARFGEGEDGEIIIYTGKREGQ